MKEDPIEEVLEDAGEVVEEVIEDVEELVEGEGFLTEGGNSTNTTAVNGTEIVDGNVTMGNETLEADGNNTINATELEGPVDESVSDEDYEGGGHHVDSMSLEDLGEKDDTIAEMEEELMEEGDAVLDPEDQGEGELGELPSESMDNSTLTNSTESVEMAPEEDEEDSPPEEEEEVVRPILMELVVIS